MGAAGELTIEGAPLRDWAYPGTEAKFCDVNDNRFRGTPLLDTTEGERVMVDVDPASDRSAAVGAPIGADLTQSGVRSDGESSELRLCEASEFDMNAGRIGGKAEVRPISVGEGRLLCHSSMASIGRPADSPTLERWRYDPGSDKTGSPRLTRPLRPLRPLRIDEAGPEGASASEVALGIDTPGLVGTVRLTPVVESEEAVEAGTDKAPPASCPGADANDSGCDAGAVEPDQLFTGVESTLLLRG